MEIKKIVSWRGVWMGLAILWIVLFHSGIEIDSWIFSSIKKYGYGGVDIFMLASGIGCYCSYGKDEDYGKFIGRRAKRLLPPYLIVITLWILYEVGICKNSLGPLLGNYSGLQLFTGKGHYFNWYIGALILTYVCVPFFYSVCQWLGDRTWKALVSIVVLGVVSIMFWGSGDQMIVATRMPLFLLGMYVGKLVKNQYIIKGRDIVLLLGSMCFGIVFLWYVNECYADYLWIHGLWWYPFLFITPGLCFCISFVAGVATKWQGIKLLLRGIERIGGCTFELFLVHVLIFGMTEDAIKYGLVEKNNALWMLAIIVACVGAYGLSVLDKYINTLIKA